MKTKMKLISDGDVSGALMVTNKKYNIDIFLGIGGGPEGVLLHLQLMRLDVNFKVDFFLKMIKIFLELKKWE